MAIRHKGGQEEKCREKERCEAGGIDGDRGRKEATGESDAVIQKTLQYIEMVVV